MHLLGKLFLYNQRMLFDERPSDFNPKFEVAACFCVNDGKALFLQRHTTKDYGEKWNLPAGKLEPDETPINAAIREVSEETGITLSPNQVVLIKTYYSRLPEYDYLFHSFKATVPNQDVAIKDDEALDFGLFAPQEALKLDLVPDEDICIKDAFRGTS